MPRLRTWFRSGFAKSRKITWSSTCTAPRALSSEIKFVAHVHGDEPHRDLDRAGAARVANGAIARARTGRGSGSSARVWPVHDGAAIVDRAADRLPDQPGSRSGRGRRG